MAARTAGMAARSLIRFLNPWKHRREELRLRVEALRQRDGDACRRCRRAIRFELPPGHDLGPRIDEISSGLDADADQLANLCLTHGRCNVGAHDQTEAVLERLRPQREAELFAKARNGQRAA
ncbi:MAG: hypothetical protein ABIQ32_09585 [Sphingomicrobium sp.]